MNRNSTHASSVVFKLKYLYSEVDKSFAFNLRFVCIYIRCKMNIQHSAEIPNPTKTKVKSKKSILPLIRGK